VVNEETIIQSVLVVKGNEFEEEQGVGTLYKRYRPAWTIGKKQRAEN